ncbi:MAG: membrane protein insertase YidC [Bacteroidetes bacterium]|nr:membrane protein insertase YidC [Bacteroidota bacterium]
MQQKQDLDKNAIIGLVLIVLIVIGFVYMNQPSQEEQLIKKRYTDSVELASKKQLQQAEVKAPAVNDTLAHKQDSAALGEFSKLANGQEQLVTLENEQLKVTISSKGGRPVLAQLKKYKKFDTINLVTLLRGENSRFDYSFATTENKSIESWKLFFTPNKSSLNVTSNSDSVIFTSQLSDNQYIQHIYTLPAKGFNLSLSLRLVGFENVIARNSNSLLLNWSNLPEKQEAIVKAEREKTSIYYKIPGDEAADNLGERKDEKEDIKTALHWVSFKQQYFNTTLVAKTNFAEGAVLEAKNLGSDSLIKDLSATLYIPYNHKADERFDMNIFMGPNHFGDFQKQQSETMSLYRKAGVNPMGGCFPMLLQLPILFAMFQFFPSAFELRQQSFLWASDLSMYDSIWDFGYVPIINSIYGDHVSLFTLMMTVSSIIFTMMNNQMTGASGQMKYIGLIMPVIFLGFFNNYAAGLTWYYFLSNLITILQQLLIRRFIDEKALHAAMQENKKKPVKKSGFQQRLEDMAKKRGIDPNTLKGKK